MSTEVEEAVAIERELWESALGYDFLSDIERRLHSFTANLNALGRHQRGERSGRPGLPDESPVYLNLLGLEWRALVPSTWGREPISVYQQMANLCEATAIAAVRAVGNARWAVNEHRRCEQLMALCAEAADEIEMLGAMSELTERLREASS